MMNNILTTEPSKTILRRQFENFPFSYHESRFDIHLLNTKQQIFVFFMRGFVFNIDDNGVYIIRTADTFIMVLDQHQHQISNLRESLC